MYGLPDDIPQESKHVGVFKVLMLYRVVEKSLCTPLLFINVRCTETF